MDNGKAVLITGTSSGIGKACALHLDKLGFKVYAGVRRESDGESIEREASGKLVPVILDVTDSESIESVVSKIEQENEGKLFGLVNNAGIGISGVVEVTPVEEMRKVIDVNVIGLYAVTKLCIPLIRNARGRIINIGSTSSFLAYAGSSVYCASKYAVRAITESLRQEMKLFDVPVVLVAPGPVESEIWKKSAEYKKKLRAEIDPELAQLYSVFVKFGDKLLSEVKPIPAEKAAEVVTVALTSRRPKPIYLVGKDGKGAYILSKIPRRMLDWMIMKYVNRLIK
jgi:short-subunit dehydrogenase